MTRGKFITLEGGEGTGKSTCLASVLEELRQSAIDAMATREPGGTPLGEKLRSVLLEPSAESINDNAELLIMFAARAQHIAEVIEPALAAGRWVVSDRFTDATYAYQGGGRQIPDERISIIEQWVQGDLQPDLTLLLDVPVKVGLQRIGQRGSLDRIERENLHFFDNVRSAYLQRARRFPKRFRIISTDRDIDSVTAAVRSEIQRLIASEAI
jgi:dTMP kinase